MRHKKQIQGATKVSPEVKKGVISIGWFTLAFFSLLSLLKTAGQAGIVFDLGAGAILGLFRFLIPAVAAGAGIAALSGKRARPPWPVGLLIVSLLGLLHLRIGDPPSLENLSVGGGYPGFLIAIFFKRVMGVTAATLILTALFVSSLLLTFRLPLLTLLKKLPKMPLRTIWQKLFTRKVPTKENEGTAVKTNESEARAAPAKILAQQPASPVQPSTEIGGVASEEVARGTTSRPQHIARATTVFAGQPERPYEIPLDLLEDRQETPETVDLEATKIKIQKTLEHFGIPVEMGEIDVGPTVTRYAFRPAEGIKLARITALSADLALALAAHPIRIEAPIPGKSLVGIEVPNQRVATVSLKEILASDLWQKRPSNLTVGLGRDVGGNIILADIKKMPHLLLAGATGSGKTVTLNSLIVSLLYANSPSTCRLLLIDPKRVEFPIYNGIPHLVSPVITESKKTVHALRFAIREMDRRFEMFEEQGARDIASFNEGKGLRDSLPYLVIVIDELADLMAVAASEVEGAIIRLAQMARATGIHLIVATQRPSVDVITGLIKANITARVAFSVASSVDSRTIMDASGAEKLLGRGDMLFVSPEFSKPRRIQSAFLKENEIKRVVEYLKTNIPQPPLFETSETPVSEVKFEEYEGEGLEDDEELFTAAKAIVLEAKKASATLLQRRLKIGYARAARILDLLEKRGIVGPAEGAKPREIKEV